MASHAFMARLLVDFRAVLFGANWFSVRPLGDKLVKSPEMLNAVRFPVSSQTLRLLRSKLCQQRAHALLLGKDEVLLDLAFDLFFASVFVAARVTDAVRHVPENE